MHYVRKAADVICPKCGNNVSNDKTVCPLCGYELAETQSIPKFRARWCESCGALVPDGVSVCPKCSHPLEPEQQTPAHNKRDIRLPDIDIESSLALMNADLSKQIDSRDVSHFESAIPSYGEIEATERHESLPKTRMLLLAALASLLIVGGAVIAITHPFDPERFDERATVEADMSDAGALESIETLQGQDSSGSDKQASTFTLLKDAHDKLGSIAEEIAANEELYASVCLEADRAKRQAGAQDAQAIAIELSNLISEVGQAGGPSSVYSRDIEQLITLGNWLRNRVDALTAAWSSCLSFENPQDHADELTNYLQNTGTSAYIDYFNENFEAFEPQLKD